MTAFDPAQIAPDWQSQKDALSRAYQQGLINLNARKGNLMSQYGFLNNGSYDTSGNALDFANLSVDPNQQYGAYRNELKSEADQLDAADNGPDRGFSGGLSNQAKRTAQQAVQGRQTAFQQNLQQQLGNLNLDAGNQSFNYGEGIRNVNQNATEYAGGQALWQAANPTGSYVVPGASGGGSTPIKPQSSGALSANAVGTANAFGYQVTKNPKNLHPVTFGPAQSGNYGVTGYHGRA